MVLRVDIWVKHLISIVFKQAQVLIHNVLIHSRTTLSISKIYVDIFDPRRFSLASWISHIELFHTMAMNGVRARATRIKSYVTLIVILSFCCQIIIIFTTN